MAASRTDRVYHQDYIARIRYSNTLPPPPNPPKLLDIPDVSLASGQYTSTNFAARLSREQPLNIEADAELGMPLNLIGLPGVFDGDESSKMNSIISRLSAHTYTSNIRSRSPTATSSSRQSSTTTTFYARQRRPSFWRQLPTKNGIHRVRRHDTDRRLKITSKAGQPKAKATRTRQGGSPAHD
jgi:hypothetical protein